MSHKGWFDIPGVQAGARTLAEQMLGLDDALAEAAGERVLDLGCAEGLIAREFLEAGAAWVCGIEVNPVTCAEARRQLGLAAEVHQANLNAEPLPPGPWPVVLALAILHKLERPGDLVGRLAEVGARLVVVRLPRGSSGAFVTKHYGNRCDLGEVFPAHGFALEKTLPGPKGELVQYWRRAA